MTSYEYWLEGTLFFPDLVHFIFHDFLPFLTLLIPKKQSILHSFFGLVGLVQKKFLIIECFYFVDIF